ncbi:hypothetical protein B0H14DRAFT_2573705 [Mycena olivaceomarginata]|nr:hypothetical protein B0H14DRAFT_2573705 [Mycena olivaceomarginata]
MSQHRKSKNPEVLKVAQDIQEIVEGLDPAVANRWFHYKPNARSSKQQENYSPLPSPEKLPQKRKAEAVKSEPIDLSLDSDDSDCAAASSSHTAKKTKRSTSTDADDLDAVEMSFCVYVETPPPPILSTRKANTKPLPTKTTTLGPFECMSSFTFPEFLDIIATALMVKALIDRRKDYIFSIFMAPPRFVKVELPWKESGDEGPKVPLNFEYGIDDLHGGGSVLSIRDQLVRTCFPFDILS